MDLKSSQLSPLLFQEAEIILILVAAWLVQLVEHWLANNVFQV